MSKPSVRLAALAFEIAPGSDVPTEAHLLPAGEFRAEDGRPLDTESWKLNAAIAAQVIERLRQRKNDTLIDYEHQSLRAEYNGQPVPAAGWFHDMEYRDGKGLYAISIEWTANARQRITEREYRYISAVFFYYVGTGEVLDVISVALTNTPAIDGMDSLDAGDLATLTRKYQIADLTLENDPMAKAEEELGALRVSHAELTAKHDAATTNVATLTTQVAALTAERDTLKVTVAALEQEKADIAKAAAEEKHKDLLVAALKDGRLTPAQKGWAEKQDLASLTEYLDATNPHPATKAQASARHDGGGVDTQDANALAIAARKYQSEQAALGIAVSVIDAVEHVMGGRNG